jgi:hypothetical protein
MYKLIACGLILGLPGPVMELTLNFCRSNFYFVVILMVLRAYPKSQ